MPSFVRQLVTGDESASTDDESQAMKDFLGSQTSTLSSADIDPANAACFHRYERGMEAKRGGGMAGAAALLEQSRQPPSIYKGHYRELFKIWRAMNRDDLKAGKYIDVVGRVTTMIRFDDEMIDVMLKHWGQVQRKELPEAYSDSSGNLLKTDAKALLMSALALGDSDLVQLSELQLYRVAARNHA